MRLVHNLTLRAEALMLAGHVGDATRTVAEAVAASITAEERFYEPQLRLLEERLRSPGA